jgi:hypothetical protein
MSSCHFPLQILPTLSSAIPIASRTDDGRGATSRPSGDADDGEAEDATVVQAAVYPVIQVAACQGLEPPA